jgi:subtilisin-like proprotein convertase family protein
MPLRIRSTLCAIALIAAAFTTAPAPAQADDAAIDPTLPTALTHRVRALAAIGGVELPPLDLAAVEQEDVKRDREGLAPRYAMPIPASITPANAGSWEDVRGGFRMWRLRITAPGAYSINLGFTRYVMPEGGRLMVYAADLGHVVRPFTAADNESHGQLWTPVVPSDDVVVEVTVPAGSVGDLELELTQIGHGYRGFGAPPDPQEAVLSGSCNVDIICPEGDDWEPEIGTVGVISTGGSTFCTGFMVNNTSNDLMPYFMTAEHCGIGAGNAASLVVYWNYENSWCRTPGSPESGQPGDGVLDQFNTGSFFRAEYDPSDMTLVLLDDDPDPEWQVGFAGWDRGTHDAPSAVAIHHPNTDEKRISFEFDPTTTTSYLGDGQPGDGTHVRVEDWDIGTTEPGSSGSPLFDQNHRVIGQLHGGYAACGNDDPDWYGRFSLSWTGGGSPSSRLSDWLDTAGTGATVVDTIAGGGLIVTPSGTVEHIGEVGGPFTDPLVVYTMSNPTPEDIDFHVSLTASFGLLLDGDTLPISGTLAALGGTRDVTVRLGPACDSLPAGVFVEDVVFEDVTNGMDRVRQHVVEVGQTLFSVEPQDDLETGGPVGGPFTDTMDYVITSLRPTPVTVEVTADAPWVALDGGAGPVTLELTGTGVFDTVTVGLSAAADTLPAGLHAATVAFANDSGGGGDTTRDVVLDVGRFVYPTTDPPLPIDDHETTVSTIDVPDDYCIGDVDVEVDIAHTFIGDLTVDLTSPQGTTVRLHDRSGGSTNDLVVTYDDETHLPDGPGRLSDFDLERADGTWTLTVNDLAGGDQGTLRDWTLRIATLGDDCPEPVLVEAFDLDTDPGWSTTGQWAWGQPTGGGGEYGNPDPTTGHTGTNVLGYNLNGDYENGMPERYLMSGPIDCSSLTHTRLKFQRWLNVETSTYDHASVQVSHDGTTWVTVWENTSEITDASWTLQSIDIGDVADGSETVHLRWTMGPTDGSWRYSGWNLDDVEIWGVTGAACPADIDVSGDVGFDDLLAVLSNWGPCVGCPADIDGDDDVGFGDLLEVLSNWGPCP